MKVTEAINENGKLLYFEIRNDNGMQIGSTWANLVPFEGCEPVTLEDARKNAILWAAAPDMLEALEAIRGIEAWINDGPMTELFQKKVYPAINKARGL